MGFNVSVTQLYLMGTELLRSNWLAEELEFFLNIIYFFAQSM